MATMYFDNVVVADTLTVVGETSTSETVGTLTVTTLLQSAAGEIAMGAAPGTTAAINVDANSYAAVAMRVVNGTTDFQVLAAASGVVTLYTNSAHAVRLGANGDARWSVLPDAAGTASLQSTQTTARLVGGSSNGLAIRNSGNTRDNLLIADAGNTATLTDGTNIAVLRVLGASTERLAGATLSGGAGLNLNLIPDTTPTVGSKVVGGYHDGTVNRSAIEWGNVASGFATLGLVKSGGYIAEFGSTVGGGDAASNVRFRKTVTGIANAVATATFTITVPNAQHRALIRVRLLGALGAGGAIGAGEAVQAITYDIGIVRTAGVNAVGTVSTAFGSAAAAVAGAATVTVTAALSAVSGAVGATNTFTVNVTISRSAGSSSNHTCECYGEVLNSQATGITIT